MKVDSIFPLEKGGIALDSHPHSGSPEAPAVCSAAGHALETNPSDKPWPALPRGPPSPAGRGVGFARQQLSHSWASVFHPCNGEENSPPSGSQHYHHDNLLISDHSRPSLGPHGQDPSGPKSSRSGAQVSCLKSGGVGTGLNHFQVS